MNAETLYKKSHRELLVTKFRRVINTIRLLYKTDPAKFRELFTLLDEDERKLSEGKQKSLKKKKQKEYKDKVTVGMYNREISKRVVYDSVNEKEFKNRENDSFVKQMALAGRNGDAAEEHTAYMKRLHKKFKGDPLKI